MNINCLNSIAEASKKNHYENFFQINFTSNKSYINIPKFKTSQELHGYLLTILKNNFTMLVATQSNAAVLNSTISTSKLGFFANNLIVDSLSTLSASGLGK